MADLFLNVGSFLSRFERQQASPPSVVVIGGGISGIAAARALTNASFEVQKIVNGLVFIYLSYLCADLFGLWLYAFSGYSTRIKESTWWPCAH